MRIWLQKSASIQKRTSPLKFDKFRWKIPNFTASYLSTKAGSRRARRRMTSPFHQPEQAIFTLVERFDAVKFGIFQRNLSNVRGLVLFCIDAKFCKKVFVGKLLTRSTRFACFCTAQTSIFQQNVSKVFCCFNTVIFIFNLWIKSELFFQHCLPF